MDNYIELTEEEVKLGFVSSCIEFVAHEMNRPYHEIFTRMQKAHMLDEYIYECYDALHCDSRENVTAELVELLLRREAQME